MKDKSIKLRSGDSGRWINHKKDKSRPTNKSKVRDTFRKVIGIILSQLSKIDKHA